MSSVTQRNPIRLFVSHVWHPDDDYHRVFEYLESASNFFYRNTSTPENRPKGEREALRGLSSSMPSGPRRRLFLKVEGSPE